MKINFKEIKLYDLDGTEIPKGNLHETVANAVYRQASNSPIKTVELAQRIYSGGEIELSPDEVSIIRDAVVNSALIGDFAKVPVLKALE